MRKWWRWFWVAACAGILAAAGVYGVLWKEAGVTGHYSFDPKTGAAHLHKGAPGEPLGDATYSEIERGLYVGGAVAEPPAGTGAVLNVCEERDAYHTEVYQQDAISDEAPAPSLEWLRKQVEFIDAQRKAGRTVYVHCHMGRSRSGMVMVAYLMWRDGVSRDEALRRVRVKRESISPNGAFMELLGKWGEALHGAAADFFIENIYKDWQTRLCDYS